VIREIWHEAWLARYGFESFRWQDQMIRKKWTIQDIIEEFFMLYKDMNRIWNGSCELNHISVN
jgi:hypothetical protein